VETENKQDWCEKGETYERSFVDTYGQQLGLTLNPGKALDKDNGKYMPDLFSYRYSVVADLKRVTTPFFTAASYGYSPGSTVTINLKDLFRYGAKYPRLIVYFWVTWPEQENYGFKVGAIEGVWASSISNLLALPPAVHNYQKRQQDAAGNAKCSMLVDLSSITRLRVS